MSRIILAALAFACPVAGQDCVKPFCHYLGCSEETDRKVGTCRYFGCSSSHGPTTCVNGACLCNHGTCGGGAGAVCIPEPVCEKVVGSCHVFGCSSGHGSTDCISGSCVCSSGTCGASDGYTCVAPGSSVDVELPEDTKRELYLDASTARLELKVERLAAQMPAVQQGSGATALVLLGAAIAAPTAAALTYLALRSGRKAPASEPFLQG